MWDAHLLLATPLHQNKGTAHQSTLFDSGAWFFINVRWAGSGVLLLPLLLEKKRSSKTKKGYYKQCREATEIGKRSYFSSPTMTWRQWNGEMNWGRSGKKVNLARRRQWQWRKRRASLCKKKSRLFWAWGTERQRGPEGMHRSTTGTGRIDWETSPACRAAHS